ncbi:hypothetical protein [Herbaspirillum sp. GW103]|uniref:hypothetical protein n=1 Tax=Herbaspirillum sp. GW103 TaxID=1175306 RepID=UPI00178C7352|nr:hypothetical protein [Herbaspirillum sp. GW103]
MKNTYLRQAGIVLILILLTFFACQAKSPVLTSVEKEHMRSISEKMTPRCFGRYLIDLPESFVLNTEGGQEIDGVTIDIKAQSETEFRQALEARKRVLESESHACHYPSSVSATPLPMAAK